MKKLLLALALVVLPSIALAQCNGVAPNNTACGNVTGTPNTPRFVPLTSFPANSPGGVSGNVQINNGAGGFAGITDTQLAAAVAGAATGGSAIQFLNGTGLFSTPPSFTSGAPGYATASGGGTTNFLRADGTWTSPTGGNTSAQPVVRAALFASGSQQTTTGTIGSAVTALTLANARDFVNGQGIRVNHVGAASGLGPTGGQAVVTVGTAGSTTYTYAVYAIDANGGNGASGGNFSVATGNATLSSTNYNSLSWSAASGSPVGYAVYGRTSGSLQLLAIVQGTTYFDQGLGFPTAPDFIPSTPPSGALNDWLVTTVASGGGTTAIVLGNATTTAGTAVGVYHDDTVAMQAGLTSAQNQKVPFYIDPATYSISSPLTCTIIGCTIYGAGQSAGSTIQLVSIAKDGIQLTISSNYLHDFNIVGNDGSVFNVAGSLINSQTGHGGDIFARLEGQFCYNGFTIASNAWDFSVTDTQCSNNVFNLTTPGDSSIRDSVGIAPVTIPGSTTAIGIFVTGDPGGLRIINNKINGSAYFIGIAITVTVSDGDSLIIGNSIEGFTQSAIQIAHSGSVSFANFVIATNQMSGGLFGIDFPDTTASLSRVSITGNLINTANDGIAIGFVTAFTISNNVISSAAVGIAITSASASGCGIGFNNFLSVTTQITDATSACTYAQVTTSKPTYP